MSTLVEPPERTSRSGRSGATAFLPQAEATGLRLDDLETGADLLRSEVVGVDQRPGVLIAIGAGWVVGVVARPAGGHEVEPGELVGVGVEVGQAPGGSHQSES